MCKLCRVNGLAANDGGKDFKLVVQDGDIRILSRLEAALAIVHMDGLCRRKARRVYGFPNRATGCAHIIAHCVVELQHAARDGAVCQAAFYAFHENWLAPQRIFAIFQAPARVQSVISTSLSPFILRTSGKTAGLM